MFVISLITFLLLTGLIYGQETNTTAFTLSPEEQKLFDQEKCALLLPHLEEAVKSLTPEQTTNLSGDILYKTGACYNAISRYEDALAVLNRAEKSFQPG